MKDANDPNPLMRALAVRTMGCIRVERITEYLCEPLARCLRDEDCLTACVTPTLRTEQEFASALPGAAEAQPVGQCFLPGAGDRAAGA